MITMKRVLLFAGISLFSGIATAQSYPYRPIRWIVPYPPGGITDSVARIVTQKMQESLGQPVLIENRPGPNSILGADLAAKAAPDGYTFLTVIAAHAANATLYAGRLPYDSVKSFAPVSLAGIAPLILTSSNAFPAKTVKELIEYAKANPGKISFGSSGIGAAAHLTTELLKQTAGIEMVHVPFKGTAPALQSLMTGDIQLLIDTPSSLLPPARGGRIRALALFSARRIPGAADVPTVAESGGPAIESATWVAFLAPAGTPRDIVTRISSEAARAINLPEIRSRFEQSGIEPIGGTPEQLARFIDDEIAKWAKVIQTAGVKPE